ncbi:MAG: hypothetical protein ACWA6X_13765 [Bauldia sp.]
MVERRKPELRAEREARLAAALRRNLRLRKDAAGPNDGDDPPEVDAPERPAVAGPEGDGPEG